MKKRSSRTGSDSRFAYDGLDRVIHERARLSVLTSLVTHPKGLSFVELKGFCALTDGNLNRHLQVLEEAKLVSVSKGLDHNRPQTFCKVTGLGRKRYLGYLAVLEEVVLDVAAAARASPPGASRGRSPARR